MATSSTTEEFQPDLDFTTEREDREWECDEDSFNVHLGSTGTSYSDTAGDRCSITSDSRRGTIKTRRGYLRFDLSSAGWNSSSTINWVKVTLTSLSYTNADLIVLKSNSFASANSSVHDNFTTTAYSAEVSTWAASNSDNVITLNSTAETDINDLAGDTLYLCVKEYDHDHSRRIECRDDVDIASGWHSRTSSTDSYKPSLQVNYTAASGYSETVSGITAANMSKIIGIAKSDISKVIGV